MVDRPCSRLQIASVRILLFVLLALFFNHFAGHMASTIDRAEHDVETLEAVGEL
jgi:hypothetical protein